MENNELKRVGTFWKVSFAQFCTDLKETVGDNLAHCLGTTPDNLNKEIYRLYQSIELPKRATSGSAGYDFKLPMPIRIPATWSLKIPTGIRVEIKEGWWLGCLPRSSLGFKYRLQLDNTMGVIDSDYYYSDNEGHIFAKITNDNREGKVLSMEQGDAFMQAIFLPYGITTDDEATGVRNGGIGSTNKGA